MVDTRRYVVLYNPISNEGHLDSWHVLFIKLLCQAGQAVIALSPDPASLIKKLQAQGLEQTEALVVLGTESVSSDSSSVTASLSFVRAAWLRWQVLNDKALYQRTWYRAPVKALDRLLNTAHSLYRQTRQQRFRSPTPAITKNTTQELPLTTPKSSQATLKESLSATTLDAKQFCEQVNRVLRRYPGQVNALLNMYIDAYPSDQNTWAKFALCQDIPWFGLCITPSALPTAGYYRVPSYRGTCFLDEAVCAAYQQQMPDRVFEYLPDIADTSLPKKISVLATQILERAADRKIVFMGGSIGKQKNLARWFELIAVANPKDWFFVQIGRLNHNNLLPEDQLALTNIVEYPPENLWIQPEYLADERQFNEIIALSSVIFAVYRDFARSSNMLSKAAYFEKPLLVATGQLMGKRVEHYQIGLAVDQNSAPSMYRGLLALDSIENIKDNFGLYRQDFNEAAMQAKLLAILKNT
jgi:hypothetical protein